MVRIDRVTFPYGYPETEADLKHMRISEKGEVTFVKEVESHLLDDGTVAVSLDEMEKFPLRLVRK